jgi:hypothetical protein
LAGKWEGRWASSTKNLGGALSAAITKTDETHYKATFTAESPLGTSTYEVVFTVKRQDPSAPRVEAVRFTWGRGEVTAVA